MRLKRNSFHLYCIFLFASCLSCSSENNTETDTTSSDIETVDGIFHLALGDSYTVGQGVSYEESYPIQLETKLKTISNIEIETEVNARTASRTDNLLVDIKNSKRLSYSFVTLMVGTNNQSQNVPFSTYKSEFLELLNESIALAQSNPKKVLVLSIPDYTYTPSFQTESISDADRLRISNEIDMYNTYTENVCNGKNVRFVNITDISRQGLIDTELVAQDRLHLSGKAYEKFAERILPFVNSELKD